MMQSGSMARFGRWTMCGVVSALAVAACSKTENTATPTDTTTTTAAADTAATDSGTATAPATPAAPAATNTDTISGVKLASFTGDATKGKTDFITCQTCHAVEAGVNKIGPSLHAVVGRPAGTITGFSYTPANKNSGITWTPEKLFQYLENPQRVVPGTKMAFPGFPDPQKRADVIAYLKTLS